MDYEEKILKKLVESYRKSKKDTRTNVVNRRTKIKPESLYNKYHENDGDYDKIHSINCSVEKLINLGFVTDETEQFGTDIIAIYLNDEKVSEIEKYLRTRYGYISKDELIIRLNEVIGKYANASPICSVKCKELCECIQKRKIPKDINEMDDIMKAIAFIENNTEMLYVREMSSRVYGDSKYFEEKTINAVCGILNEFNNVLNEDNRFSDEILTKYNIYKEPQQFSIKGNVVIIIGGKTIDISAFKNGVEFSANELSSIESIRINVPIFTTIENRTSYLRYNDNNKVVFYLGGYANRFQRDFIIKVRENNPQTIFEHFGDIDAGGFWIHHNLCEITGISFRLFSMSVDELVNPDYKNCIHELTENDILRLRNLLEIEQYENVVKFMLDNNIKLEQEIISLKLMQNK